MPEDLAPLWAAIADRYRRIRELGHGGMASVHLAEDLRHGRMVAIKVLDGEIARAVGSARFLREIKTAARLTHPHILPLFDSGEAAGRVFYVMPYVDGESLRDRVQREGPLPVDEAVRLARELVRALGYAHSRGIVHRDLKPENILLSSGQALLADFGIAHALADTGTARLTGTGVAIGTPAYMSPEQCSGSRVDARADLYSLGCVLFEMLGGQPPFTGPSAESLFHQHLSVAPRSVTELRRSVPPGLSGTVMRLLAKSPADRFQSASEVESELRDGRGPSSSEERGLADEPPATMPQWVPLKRAGRRGGVFSEWPKGYRWGAVLSALIVAGLVLTFAIRNGRLFGSAQAVPPAKEWLLIADFESPDTLLALTVKDLLAAALDQSELIRVVPPGQIRAALVAADRPPESRLDGDLARELAFRNNVKAFVEGRVTPVGTGYVLTVRLQETDSLRLLANITRRVADKDEIIGWVDGVARQLRTRIGEDNGSIRATRALALVRTPSFDALRHFSQGSELVTVDPQAAREEFRAAALLDSTFATAWAGLAVAYYNFDRNLDSARFYMRRALALPTRLLDAQRHHCEGLLAIFEDDPARALQSVQAASKLGWPNATLTMGNLLREFGRDDEALVYYRRFGREQFVAPSATRRYSEWACLLDLGSFAEAESIVKLPTASAGLRANQALASGRWAHADSLGKALAHDMTRSSWERLDGARAAAGAQAARGSFRGARSTLAAALDLPGPAVGDGLVIMELWTILDLVSGPERAPAVPERPEDDHPDWPAHLALSNALSGDTSEARRFITAHDDSKATQVTRDYVALAEAVLDLRAGRLDRVKNRLGQLARTRMSSGRALSGEQAHMARWLVASAWEADGQLDSARVYYELVLERGTSFHAGWVAHAMSMPFALERLVIVNARLARYAEAERRLEELRTLMDRPDERSRQLLYDAARALTAARKREGPTGLRETRKERSGVGNGHRKQPRDSNWQRHRADNVAAPAERDKVLAARA